MTVNKVKAFLFILTIGGFSCTNDKAVDQTSKIKDSTEASPVLVAGKDEKKPNIETVKVVEDEPETVEEESPSTKPIAPTPKPTTRKINKKPSLKKPIEKVEPPIEKETVVNQAEPTSIETTEVEKMEQTTKTENAPPLVEEIEEAPLPVQASHEAWDVLLRKYVTADGKVNYSGFKTNQEELQAYLDHLAQNPIQSSWSRNDQMAYWINAYNAFTIKLIVDNYPVKSIMDLHGGKPWEVKWIKLGGKTYSLNQIENDILRPQFKDARIHFAVNCAAKSCPPLYNRAWKGSNLNSTFDQQAKKFINNPRFNKISANQVQISKIFEWYASDFDNIIDYLNKYSNTKIKSNAKVSYLDYDWALNK